MMDGYEYDDNSIVEARTEITALLEKDCDCVLSIRSSTMCSRCRRIRFLDDEITAMLDAKWPKNKI